MKCRPVLRDCHLLDEKAIQEGDHLSTGTGIVRAEGGGAGASGDLLLISRLNGLCVILVSLDICKDNSIIHRLAISHAAEEGSHLAAGAGFIGTESGGAGAAGDTLLI